MNFWRAKPAAPAPAVTTPAPAPCRPVVSANSISVTFTSTDFDILKGKLGRLSDESAKPEKEKAGPRKLKGKDTDYEHLAHLGQGSTGNVSKVRRIRDNKILACKTIDCARNASLYDFACREVEIWAAFKSEKYIAEFAQDFSWNPSTKSMRLYMEHYEGGDLQSVLDACRAEEVAIHPLVATYWATEIARGLKSCHDRGVVHKDLKPSNILLSMPYVYNDMLWAATLGETLTDKEKQLAGTFTQWLRTRTPWCHISDFGVGKTSKAGLTGENPVTASTETEYIAPESLHSPVSFTSKSNVFSLGRLLYALCQCDFPNLPADAMADDLQPLPVEYPERLRNLIPKCLKAEAASRPSSHEVVLELMEALIDFFCDAQYLKLKANIDRQINPTRPLSRTRTLSTASTLAYMNISGAVSEAMDHPITPTKLPETPGQTTLSRAVTPEPRPVISSTRTSPMYSKPPRFDLSIIQEKPAPEPVQKTPEELRADLITAWHSRDINAMEKALSAGASPNTIARSWPKIGLTTEYPLLNWTIKDGWSRIMRLLVQHGALYDVPVSEIIEQVNKQTVEVKTFFNQYHPIYLAVFIADFATLDFFFVERGYNVNSQHLERGETPLHIAIMRQDLRVVKYLLKHGASTEYRNEFGESPVHHASRSWGTKVNPCLEYLLEVFPDGVNEVDSAGNTPLHTAAKDGCLEGVKVLLRKGARANIRNKEGATPGMLAIGRTAISNALKEADGMVVLTEKDEFVQDMSVGVIPVAMVA